MASEFPKLIGYVSGRDDGRYVSSQGAVHYQMKAMTPKLDFESCVRSAEDLGPWQEKVRQKLQELMAFPKEPVDQPMPRLVWEKQREGYVTQKWEVFAEAGSIVPILMLVPDGVDEKQPGAAVMCFPGSSGTKEFLANEQEYHTDQIEPKYAAENRIAQFYAQQGLVAVAVDNPCTGETLERAGGTVNIEDARGRGRDKLSRDLMFMGRSYLGFSVYQKMCVLAWLKSLGHVDRKRIGVVGHSLGTEPAMVMAALDTEIKAVVSNDYIYQQRTMDVALAPSMDGETIYFTGGMWHCVPGMYKWFNAWPDILAAIAPRAVLCSEGGLWSGIKTVRRAYELAGAQGKFAVKHFREYSNENDRPYDNQPMPEGIHLDEYHRRANTNPANHYFKGDIAVPWLSEVLKQG